MSNNQIIEPERITLDVIVLPSTQAMLTKISPDLEEAKDLVVDSEDMAAIALEMAGRFATVREALDTERLSKTKPLRDAQSRVNGGYNPAIDFVEAAEKVLKNKLIAWNAKVTQMKREAAAKAEAERKRLEAEARAQAEAQAAEAQRLVAEAQAANAVGDADAASALIVQAQAVSDQSQQSLIPIAHAPAAYGGPATVKGARETWKARVTDKAALIQEVAVRIKAGDLFLLDMLDVNATALNALARMQKSNMRIAGVEAYPEAGISTRKGVV